MGVHDSHWLGSWTIMFRLGRRSLGPALKAVRDSPARSSVQQRRNLSIHEYLSARLLKSYGIGVPDGEVAKIAQEAETIARKIDGDDMVIKEAFDLITSDPKVTAIFVNIFGGIVRCDAIAQGLINVVQQMNLRLPIVCRLQGTNMEKAAELVNNSGLKIFSITDLQEAAAKAVDFSKIVKMAREIDVGVEFSLGI